MTAAYSGSHRASGSEPLELDRADVIAAPDGITHLRYPIKDDLYEPSRPRYTSARRASGSASARQREAPRPTDGRRSRRGMRSRASLRLRQLKADRGPAAITLFDPHAWATEKRQLIFAVGQSVPIPAVRSFTCAKRKRRSSRVAACSASFSPPVAGIWPR